VPKLNKGVRLGWLAVQRGMDTKAAALTYGCSRQMLERKAREAGMRRKLVTPDEFDLVLLGRLSALRTICAKPVVERRTKNQTFIN